MSDRQRVAYVIGFSAPPVLALADLLRLLHERGWDTYVILSPTAASWVDVDALAGISGHPVWVEARLPQEPDSLPPADAVIAAPLTFNSLNKWAAGMSDTLALGLLNEALGLSSPLIAALCAKDVLQRHPAYADSLDRLTKAGATILDPATVTLRTDTGQVTMDWRQLIPN